jgi:hypothetical protein
VAVIRLSVAFGGLKPLEIRGYPSNILEAPAGALWLPRAKKIELKSGDRAACIVLMLGKF